MRFFVLSVLTILSSSIAQAKCNGSAFFKDTPQQLGEIRISDLRIEACQSEGVVCLNAVATNNLGITRPLSAVMGWQDQGNGIFNIPFVESSNFANQGSYGRFDYVKTIQQYRILIWNHSGAVVAGFMFNCNE